MAKKPAVDRRRFLKGAAVGGVAAAFAGSAAAKAAMPEPSRAATAPIMPPEPDPATGVEVLTADRPGSDFMVDIFKSLGVEYIAANPGSSFRGLQESVINYGGNNAPEFLTCCHEEAATAMAHGYAKVEGKPMITFVHSDVGLQHASMAIYNAYCDRVPIIVMPGNTIDATARRPGVEWNHSVQDAAAMVRDFVKWDDLPISLQHFSESMVRAYKIAMTPPMMPVVIVADSELQERPMTDEMKPRIPKLTLASPPSGDSAAVNDLAKMLVAAENPVIVADRVARTPAGMARLIELAEALQAAVIDQGGRMNFPSRHPLNQTEAGRGVTGNADLILGLEVSDFWGMVNGFRDQLERTSRSTIKPGTKLVSISAGDLYMKGNYQDIQRYTELDMAIAADAEETLPSLIEAVKRYSTDDRKRVFADRGKKLADAHQKALDRAREEAAYAWDASPITTARLNMELWAQIKKEDWALLSDTNFLSHWPQKLWTFDKPYQYIGGAGGSGEGYCAPAATGAALAHRKHGRLCVTLQRDGDLMYSPGILWTAAHHKIPLVYVMHNNRAYHQEVMHLQRMAARHNRGITRAGIGTTIDNPNIDYAKVAQGLGVFAIGPITDPKELGPALKKAIEVAKAGEPALVDVVTEPR